MALEAKGPATGNDRELYVHIPTPGDHFSPATGSATMTVIYELSRVHATLGRATRVVVGRGTRHDYAVGECVEVDFRGLPSRRRRALDVAMGAMGLTRRFAAAAYRPALDAIGTGVDGPVILHNSPAVLPFFARHLPHTPVILYAHNTLFRTYSGRELRRVISPAHAIVCVSEFLAEDLASRVRGSVPQIVVVRNGVDSDRFRPHGRGVMHHEEPRILFVGRVIPEKGPDILVRAAEILLRSGRRFRLRIVGSSGFSATDPLSPYERSLRALASGLGEVVEFIPFVDRHRILEEYAGADIVCVPSNCDEGVTLTVPEALACGIPTIASRRGGIPEVGGDAVLYFAPPNAAELAERLAYLIDDPSAREEWGTRAREHARKNLGWAAQYARLRNALSP